MRAQTKLVEILNRTEKPAHYSVFTGTRKTLDTNIETKWVLQVLAMPAEEQLALFPDFVCMAEEFALDFDEYDRGTLLTFRGKLLTFGGKLKASQRTALKAVQHKLEAMSHGGIEFSYSLWEKDAVRSSQEWAAVRDLAIEALKQFGRPVQNTSQDPDERASTHVQG